MGAGDWVTGGMRRAVSGVAALLPGSSGQEPDEGQVPPEAATSDVETSASPEPAPAPTSGARPRRSRAARTPAEPVPEPEVASAPASAPAAVDDGPAPEPAARKPAARKPAPRTRTTRTAAPPESAEAESAAEQAAAVPPAPTVASAEAPTEAPAEAPAPTWSAAELDGFRSALDAEIARLREELDMGEADLADLVADSGDGSGDDQADAGSKTFEREHEMSVNANTREMIDQALRARARLDAGTYGICERCGTPIALGRLRAYPRATLCIRCKQAEERR